MTETGVARAVRHGMAFIGSVQLPNGAFESWSSPTQRPFKPVRAYETTFVPSLTLNAMSQIDSPLGDPIRAKLAAWLQTQKSPHWSFNYWASSAPQHGTMPYPDDLDDTFCALLALYQYDASIIDESCLAHVVNMLVATESKVGGPYKTWLTSDKAAVWQDVDLAVNANITAFLRLVAEPLPNITAMLEAAITTRTFTSPYYPSPYPIIYYIARAYDGKQRQTFARHILSRRSGGYWGTPLQTAVAMSSLARLGHVGEHREAVEYLLKQQLPDGSWPAEAFCIDPAIKGRTQYNGAAVLTTALVLEALTWKPHKTTPSTHNPGQTEAQHHPEVLKVARQELRGLKPAIRQKALAIVTRTMKHDTKSEIAALPHRFNASLARPLPDSQATLITQLGAANLYGWSAYGIYDDFLDNEGDPQDLPVANVLMRYSLQNFKQALPDNTAFHDAVDTTFDSIDNANTWETQHCRFEVTDHAATIALLPRYTSSLQLADRSLGHILGPLGVLVAGGLAINDPRAKAISLALRHYLVARQLNDDLHDWEQDMRAGIATYVVVKILRGLSVPPGQHALSALLPKMQQEFWHRTLPAVCTIIQTHTARARRAAKSSQLLHQTNLITLLADNIDAVVTSTLQEQTKAQNFLTAYSKPSHGH